jgi:Rubisco LSMT substrate-binding
MAVLGTQPILSKFALIILCKPFNINFRSRRARGPQSVSIGGWRRVVMSAYLSPHATLTLLILLCSVFVVDFSNELPEEIISFARLLMMSAPEWEKTKRKSKLPKPKVDDAVLSVAADVVRMRLSDYPTTIEAGFPSVELSYFSFYFNLRVHFSRTTKPYSNLKRRSPSR